jgi:hypothetical protein
MSDNVENPTQADNEIEESEYSCEGGKNLYSCYSMRNN